MNLLNESRSMEQDIKQWFEAIHKIPELGTELPKTRAYVESVLQELGISYKTYDNHSSVVAVIGKKEGLAVALRADMDALPVTEEVNCSYKSTHEGKMHACGHDSHTAMLLAAAKLLKAHEEELNGKVKLVFQTCEENFPSGADLLEKDGVLENPKVNGMFACHCSVQKNPEDIGVVTVKRGFNFASADGVRIHIIGTGGHASNPANAVDPVLISAMVIQALQNIISRELPHSMRSVLTIGKIQGGTVGNIIPDNVYLECSLRCDSEETRTFMRKRIKEIVEGICKTMRGSSKVEFSEAYLPALINDDRMVDIFTDAAQHILPDSYRITKEIQMGSEDCSFFFRKVPGCYFRINLGKAYEDGKYYYNHNSKFAIDEDYLYIGAAMMAGCAVEFLEQEGK